MKRKFSILHISDLHKGADANLDNLYNSLVMDCDDYTSQGIPKPEIVVVSGDVINGAEGDDADNIINAQYQEAQSFLDKLCRYFTEGDRTRIIIVPGNHDMNRMTSKASMVKQNEANKEKDLKDFFSGNDPWLRWSWKEFCFYKVTNKDKHKTRFANFIEFYNRFYQGRWTWDDCENRAQLIDLPDYNITFATFNSCYRLDHLNFSGAICSTAVTNQYKSLKALDDIGRLVIGVWHHHTTGLPMQNNYLDYRIMQSMIKDRIKIGLYGHQHISEVVNEYKDITAKKKMILISSGSLYGNKRLLANYPRQYNIITINMDDGKADMTLHVRKDQNPMDYDIPSWGKSHVGNSDVEEYSEEIALERPSLEQIIEFADKMVQKKGLYGLAIRMLLPHAENEMMVNKMIDSYISHIADNPELILNLIKKPMTNVQVYAVLNAGLETKNIEVLARLLAMASVKSCEWGPVKELRVKAEKMVAL